MCTQSVTPRYGDGNLERSVSAPTPATGKARAIAGWPGAADRSARKRAARAAPDASGPALLLASSADALGRRLGILDKSLFKWPEVESRQANRQPGIVLTERERQRAREMARAASACGTRWLAFRGWEPGDSSDRELRMVCQARCGTRACSECSQAIRNRECHRVSGPWKLFFTLTIPRAGRDCAQQWRQIHKYIRRITKSLKREARIAAYPTPGEPARKERFSDERVAEAASRIRCDEALEYAWVIEPHKDGFPHVHLVTSAAWVKFDWLRKTWERAIRATSAWVYGEQVYSIDGACRYLAKYISKAQLTPDILAICYRRRLWACTLERAEKPEPKWFREEETSSEESYRQAEFPDSWGKADGWQLVQGKAGGYAIWARADALGFSFGSKWMQKTSPESKDYSHAAAWERMQADALSAYKNDG